MLPHDEVTHYIPEKRLLVLTPPHVKETTYARTIECIMPISYNDLAQWQHHRKDHYQQYQAYKEQQSAMIIDCISQLYPTIKECIAEYFSATSLTYRDEYLTPEGAMFGMAEPVGGVTTRISNLFIGGQNCYLHGIYGTIMTAIETIKSMENNDV
jgi:all-trans-retinol 13,14-reductase